MTAEELPPTDAVQVETFDLTAVPDVRLEELDAGRPAGLRFLKALEITGAACPDTGWTPCHLGLTARGQLLAVLPLYLKAHSSGEFFFDWGWAHAMHGAGIPWYPKLVSTIPFTPVDGPRLIAASEVSEDQRRLLLAAANLKLQDLAATQLQLLFHAEEERELWATGEGLARTQLRYVWRDDSYGDFDGYLRALRSRRRKSIRKERAAFADTDLDFHWQPLAALDAADQAQVHRCYAVTYAQRGQAPYLREATLRELGRVLGDALPVLTVRRDGQVIAASLCLRDERTLYGRHWGCLEELPGLHFEACYYRGIEYCLTEGLTVFDPGVQGEHKLLRGFLPELSHATYRFADPSWTRLFDEVLADERRVVEAQLAAAREHDPFVERDA